MLAHKLLSIEELKSTLDFDKKIFIGYSGGPDSSALLYFLSKICSEYNLDLSAIHINHNISKNSNDWEVHCKETCKDLKINFINESTNIIPSGGGTEASARNERYRIFEKYLDHNDQLLTAHHSDDVTETIFLRLLRGTGIDGLQGPHKKRNLGKGYVIRPFLNISKKDIMQYLELNKIKYIQDSSNIDNSFDRNFLRNEIFPVLNDRWNDFSKRVFKTSQLIEERNTNFSNLLKNNYKDLVKNKINKDELMKLDTEIIKEVLRHAIKEEGISMPSSKVLEEVIKTFIHSNPTSKSIVSWSRADKEQLAGKITFEDGKILISRKE